MRELTCPEVVELATEYLEEVLPEAERRRFREHIGDCRGCKTYLDQMRQTIALLGQVPQESPSPYLRQRLLAAFRDWSRA